MAMTKKQKIRLWSGVAAAVLIVILIIQNRDPVTTMVFFWEFTISRSLLLIVTLAVGAGLGYYVGKYGLPGAAAAKR